MNPPSPFDFNDHQAKAVTAYGTGQGAVDYILSARYGGLPSDPSQPEGFGMVSSPVPSPAFLSSAPVLYKWRYRGL